MAWTEEKVKKLKELWKKGYSTGEIGKMIGVSKNAVVGKAHRLELDSRPSPIKPDHEPLKKKVKKTKEPEKPVKKKKNEPASKEKTVSEPAVKKTAGPEEKGVSLLNLTSSSCRWPLGDPKEKNFSFCGKPALEGKPYCAEHAKIAYVGIEKRGHKSDE